MASRSSSRSEGEVLTSDSETKANTALSSRNGIKVDRRTRPYPVARSPLPRSKRSRSRSPYRAQRGEKRRRDDDDMRDRSRRDPRVFNIRYEDNRHDHKRHPSYDNREVKRHHTFSRSRSRSRSRSPYRHRQSGNALGWEDRKEDRHGVSGTGKEDYHSTKPSVSQQSGGPAEAPTFKIHAEYSHEQNMLRQSEKSASLGTDKQRLEEVPTTDSDAGAMTDETALIEERRKRREAIKNKYRGPAIPLLVQALHIGRDSSHGTPGVESSGATPRTSVSPAPLSPQTPQESLFSAPDGANFAKDEDLTNDDRRSPIDDEPSAADYDPTADMEEERARHDKRLFKEDEESLGAADLEQAVERTAENQPEAIAATEPDEFDMFAEHDDDDMFAEAPAKVKPSEKKVAQALDATMMDNWDDPDGYYITILGELIENRYHVTQNIGRGMFSSVVRATDSKTKQEVAIKIVRSNESMRKAGVKELDILKDIAANDPEDKKHVIRLYRSFDHKGHLCMVFENLSMNLREVLKKFGRDVGINLKAIRAYAQQLLLGLSLLKKCQYLHADLKPDNILVNESRSTLKICDLGSASPITENATAPYLVSRFYRAPEVILGIPYDYGIDMWSVGCTLFELYTGKILFTGRNNNNMLRVIMDCRGKFPNKLLRRGTLAYEYFDDLLNFRAVETDKVTGRAVTKLIDIKPKPVRDLRARLIPKEKKMNEQERKELELFLDLLDKCLDLRPEKRITPNEALKHPFILRSKA